MHPDLRRPPAEICLYAQHQASMCAPKQGAFSAHTNYRWRKALLALGCVSGSSDDQRNPHSKALLLMTHPLVGMTFMPTRHPIKPNQLGPPQPRVPRVP